MCILGYLLIRGEIVRLGPVTFNRTLDHLDGFATHIAVFHSILWAELALAREDPINRFLGIYACHQVLENDKGGVVGILP